MGFSRWNSSDWDSYTKTTTAGKTRATIFASTSLKDSLDPKNIKIRESRDSSLNPNSTALIVNVDVTGSMGMLAETLVRKGCDTLATEIYNRKPISDPHILFAANGDAAFDRAPLQAGQFEADITGAKQLQDIWLEGGGGGNCYESYLLPWWLAARHTSIDCFEKRNKKGYLFTIGDEEPQMVLRKEEIEKVFGYKAEDDISARDLLTMVSRQWEVFHIMAEEGSHYRSHGAQVARKWGELLGQRALRLSDHTKMAELIVSTIQVIEGERAEDVASSWDGSTSVVIRDAIWGLSAAKTGSAVMRF